MSYSTIEIAVQDILQGLAQFADADVTRGDYRVLDSIEDDAAILAPGSFTQADVRAQMSYRTWDVLVDYFYVYRDDGTSETNFATGRDNIIAELEKYPTLDGTSGIIQIRVSADGDAEPVDDEDGRGPFFLWQRLRVTVVERVDISGGEFA